MSKKNRDNPDPARRPDFAPTRWSVVMAAGNSSSVQQKEALETLCRSYWFPLYAFIRRRGYDRHEAEDCTQAFFAHVLEKRKLKAADPECGKFRTFLLIRLKNFLSDRRRHARALKRGVGKKIISLGSFDAESRYALEPADEMSPDILFEKSWALTVLKRTMDHLETRMAEPDKKKLFQNLKVYLTADKTVIPYQNMAAKLDMTEGSVRVAVHRLRRLYRNLLRDEIAQTLGDQGSVDEEMAHLFEALAR